MYKILISNSTKNEYNLPLRKKSKDSSYLEDFYVPAYALNFELSFLSEDDYNAWYKSYESYFVGDYAIFRIGKETGNKLEKINKEVEKKTEKKRQSDVNSISNTDETLGVNIEVDKA